MPPQGSSSPALRALIAVAFVLAAAVVALFVSIRSLRDDINDLRARNPSVPTPNTEPAPTVGDEDLEELRRCFNRALENSFEDFSRYVFGDEEFPGIDKVIETCGTLSTKIRAELYKGGLDFPVDMAWLPGTDTIFFTEKATGKIRVMHGRDLVSDPCVRVAVAAEGERGTLGIALHPEFENSPYLYVYYTNAEPLENRVTRFTVEGDRCVAPEHIVTAIPALDSTRHNGGQLEIVADKLFVSVGDGYEDPATAQDPSSLLGKILRYNLDGSIPSDNPFGDNNPAWTMGHRNPFGLTHDPETGRMYATENGPDCDDELNLIDRGENYGWGPGYECGTAGVGQDPESPLVRWTPPIVPTDPWFYRGTTSELAGDLYAGDFNAGKLRRFELDDAGGRVVGLEVIYDSPSQIVDVSAGPNGLLYFLTPTGIYRLEGG